MIYVKSFDNIINDYIDKCSPEEWEELLNKYCIDDTENYMGEVRENLEETIKNIYNSSTLEEQTKILKFFSKYTDEEKVNEL